MFADGFSIVPEACRVCPAGWQCVLTLVDNLVNLAMSLGVLITIFVITYAGVLLLLTPTNPENRSQASKMLINAVIGLVIVLASWLIIDKILEVLGAEGFDSVEGTTGVLGSGGEECIVAGARFDPLAPAGSGVEAGPDAGGGTGNNCPAADPATMVQFPASATDGESESATQTTVNNFLAMREAALRDGIDIRVTDGYRSDAEQVALWERYGHDTSQVARPCSLNGNGSNHNSGTALDLAVGCRKTNSSCDSPAFNWLKAHGAEYGFRNDLPNDVVHWSPSGH